MYHFPDVTTPLPDHTSSQHHNYTTPVPLSNAPPSFPGLAKMQRRRRKMCCCRLCGCGWVKEGQWGGGGSLLGAVCGWFIWKEGEKGKGHMVPGYVTILLYCTSIDFRMSKTPCALIIAFARSGPPSSSPSDSIHFLFSIAYRQPTKSKKANKCAPTQRT